MLGVSFVITSTSHHKKRVAPDVFAKALTLLSQLLGFFTLSASLKSHTVASAISMLNIISPS